MTTVDRDVSHRRHGADLPGHGVRGARGGSGQPMCAARAAGRDNQCLQLRLVGDVMGAGIKLL